MANAKKDNSGWWLIALIVSGVAIFVPFLVIIILGNVAGEEFSPQTLEYRSFRYYEVPGLRWQVGYVRYVSRPAPTIDDLRTAPYFPKATNATPRWDLIHGERVFRNASGDAQILWAYLSAKDHLGNSVWHQWSTDNPKLAAVLWPVVMEAAREGNYVKIPDLFANAQEAKTDEELAAKLDVPVPQVPATHTTVTPTPGTSSDATPQPATEKKPSDDEKEKVEPTSQPTEGSPAAEATSKDES